MGFLDEHITKGELHVCPLDSTTIRDTVNDIVAESDPWHLGRKRELANAAELVRRWNAFEPGGEVEKLREALADILQWDALIRQNYPDMAGLIRAFDYARDALNP